MLRLATAILLFYLTIAVITLCVVAADEDIEVEEKPTPHFVRLGNGLVADLWCYELSRFCVVLDACDECIQKAT